MTQEERDHIMDLIEKVHTEQTDSASSHLAFLLECVKQAFSREVNVLRSGLNIQKMRFFSRRSSSSIHSNSG